MDDARTDLGFGGGSSALKTEANFGTIVREQFRVRLKK